MQLIIARNMVIVAYLAFVNVYNLIWAKATDQIAEMFQKEASTTVNQRTRNVIARMKVVTHDSRNYSLSGILVWTAFAIHDLLPFQWHLVAMLCTFMQTTQMQTRRQVAQKQKRNHESKMSHSELGFKTEYGAIATPSQEWINIFLSSNKPTSPTNHIFKIFTRSEIQKSNQEILAN
jgi:hypothetical protein